MCVCCFSSSWDKIPDGAAGRREGDSRVRSHGAEGVAAGHMASAVRQQRPMDAGDQLAFSFFFSLKQNPLG